MIQPSTSPLQWPKIEPFHSLAPFPYYTTPAISTDRKQQFQLNIHLQHQHQHRQQLQLDNQGQNSSNINDLDQNPQQLQQTTVSPTRFQPKNDEPNPPNVSISRKQQLQRHLIHFL